MIQTSYPLSSGFSSLFVSGTRSKRTFSLTLAISQLIAILGFGLLSADVFSEEIFESKRPPLWCSKALSSSPTTETSPEISIPSPAGVYINLLEQVLSEISNINVVAEPIDLLSLQYRFLQTIAKSQAPLDPLDVFAADLAIRSLFNQSHLLRFLISAKAFQKVLVTLSDTDWFFVKDFSTKRISAMQAQHQTQISVRVDSEEDFVEVTPDSQERVRLHYFIEQRDFADAIILLRSPTTPTRYLNTRDKNNQTPLDVLIQMSPELERFFPMNPNPLSSLKKGTLQPDLEALVEWLQMKGAKTSSQILKLQKKLLKLAEEIGNEEAIVWTFQQGADLNFVDRHGRSAIIGAVESGRSEVVRLLASLGADISTPNGYTLAEIAVHRSDAKTLRVLAEIGVNLHTEDLHHPTPVFNLNITWKMMEESPERIEELFQVFKDFGVDLNYARPLDLKTPAHNSVLFENPLNLQTLAKFGADLDKQDRLGNRPIDDVICPQRKSALDYPVFLHSPNFLSQLEKVCFNSTTQQILEIFYNYYIEKGIPPPERGLEKKILDGKVVYQYLGTPKFAEGPY